MVYENGVKNIQAAAYNEAYGRYYLSDFSCDCQNSQNWSNG